MPTKTWVPGESVVAADMNSYVQNQVISTHTTNAARTAAIPTPTQGMVSFLNDQVALQIYVGTAWKNLPYGILGSATLTADTADVGSAGLTIPGLSVTFQNVGLTRRVKATFRANFYCNTNTLVRVTLYEGASVLNQSYIGVALTGSGFNNVSQTTLLSPSQGTHTYDMNLSCDSGLVHFTATGNAPTQLIVEDIG